MVGSGIVGASCAYVASSLGAEVLLVDAAKPGRATAAGAGIICPWSAQVADPAWCALACAAAREYPALTARLADLGETDVGYRQVGALALAEREEDREQIRQALLARRAAAPEIGDVAELSGADAQRLFPPLRADAAAVYIGGAARVDGRKLAAALARAAVRQGAVVRDGDADLARGCGRGKARRRAHRGRRGHRRHRRVDQVLPAGGRPGGPCRGPARPDHAHLARRGRHQPVAGGAARRQRPLPAGLR